MPFHTPAVKNWGVIKAISLLILALIVCSAAVVFAEAPAAAPIKVGVILPLSGQYAAIGRDAERAIELSAKDDLRLTFIFEDSRFEASQAVTAYRKLVDQDKIDALINLDSVSIKALGPLIDRDKILTLQLAECPEHKADTLFQIMPSSFPLYDKLGEAAAHKFRRIALVYGESEFLAIDGAHFKQAVGSQRIVSESALPSGTDYASTATRILNSNPDAATFFLNVEDGVKFLQALVKQGGRKRVSLICDANTVFNIQTYTKALGAELFEGCIAAVLPNNTSESFRKTFREHYGEDPAAVADYAYDAATILKAMPALPKPKWPNAVQDFKGSGVSGRIEFDAEGTRLPAAELQVFRNGKFKLAQP